MGTLVNCSFSPWRFISSWYREGLSFIIICNAVSNCCYTWPGIQHLNTEVMLEWNSCNKIYTLKYVLLHATILINSHSSSKHTAGNLMWVTLSKLFKWLCQLAFIPLCIQARRGSTCNLPGFFWTCFQGYLHKSRVTLVVQREMICTCEHHKVDTVYCIIIYSCFQSLLYRGVGKSWEWGK